MRRFIPLVFLLVMAVAAPSFVAAESGKKCDKPASSCPKKKHHGHKKGYLFYGALSKLDLSPKQKAELAKLKLNYKKEKIKAESRIKVLEVELKELLLGGSIDLDSIRAKLEEIEREKVEFRFARYRALKDLMDILTPKQRKELREKFLYSMHP